MKNRRGFSTGNYSLCNKLFWIFLLNVNAYCILTTYETKVTRKNNNIFLGYARSPADIVSENLPYGNRPYENCPVLACQKQRALTCIDFVALRK